MWNALSGVRRTARTLAREPGFSIPALLCLTLTIGSATAVFAVADAALLRPLPFPSAERIRGLYALIEQSGDLRYNLSPAKLGLLRERSRAFESLAAWRDGGVTLAGGDEPRRLNAAFVEPGFFVALGLQPRVGNPFEEPARSGERVAYVSEGVWLQEFGGDPGRIGERIVVDDGPATLVGVVPAHQVVPVGVDIWLPLHVDDVPPNLFHGGNLGVVGRLRPGVSDAELAAELDAVAAEVRERWPDNYATHSLGAQSLREAILGDVDRLLLLLLATAGLLLVLGSANVANLVLVRNRGQRRQVATRAALGAPPTRIAAWLLGELSLLAVAAALLGTGVAAATAPALFRLAEIAGPGMDANVLEPRILGFTVAVTAVCALGVGLLPATGAARRDVAAALRTARGDDAGGRGARRSQRLLVGAQATLGVLLMVGAGQSLGELSRIGRADPGFDPDGVVTFRLHAPERRYPDEESYRRLFLDLRDAVSVAPGVEAAGASSALPVGDPGAGFSLSIEERPPDDPSSVEVAQGRLLVAGYLETMGIRLRAGRAIVASDTVDAERVVVVNRAFAERYWPGESAIGKRIKRRTYGSAFPWLRVVGVVGDVRERGLDRPPVPTVYFPHAQTDASFGREMTLAVRTSLPPAEIAPLVHARIAEVDPTLPVIRVATMGDLMAESLATRRLAARMVGVFAVFGLLLLGAGTYGVVAFAVGQRRGEIGLRFALGADGSSLVRLLMRDSLWALAAGTGAGLGISLLLGQALGTPLVPAAPSAPHASAAVVLLLIGSVASLLPARRVLRHDPAAAMRGGAAR